MEISMDKSEKSVNDFNIVKSNEMPWNLFFQKMNEQIILLDLPESKNLIFNLLEEIKGFLEREEYYKNKIFEFDQSNENLRTEIESLKKECDELKRKFASSFVPKENQNDLSNNPQDTGRGKHLRQIFLLKRAMTPTFTWDLPQK